MKSIPVYAYDPLTTNVLSSLSFPIEAMFMPFWVSKLSIEKGRFFFNSIRTFQNQKNDKKNALVIEFVRSLLGFDAGSFGFHNITGKISWWSIVFARDKMNVFFAGKIGEIRFDRFLYFSRRCYGNECSTNQDLNKNKLKYHIFVIGNLHINSELTE